MSVLRPATASNTTSPPLPPSPPSGPPNSTNFSRRKLTAPGPPAPERTKILAWSRKCIGRRLRQAGGERKLGRRARRAIEPADVADDRADEVVVDRASGDEHAKVDRAGGGAEQAFAVDPGGKLAAADCGFEHRRDLGHALVEIGARVILVVTRPQLCRDLQEGGAEGRLKHFDELA